MQIIHDENIKGDKFAVKTIIVIFIIGIIIGIPVILSNLDDKPAGANLPKTDIDWNNPPCSPRELSSNWIEKTPELMKERSQRREFQHKETGLKIAFDKGIKGKPRFRGKDHWHIYNPNSTNINNYYLDKNGEPIHKNDVNSHIEIRCI